MTVTKHVDLEIYRRNLLEIVAEMIPAKVMAVLKADAYGHGLVECARVAEEVGIELIGTLDIETALALRSAGIETPTFAWLHSPQSDFEQAVRANVELSVSSLAELERIASSSGVAKVHLKLDSGLSRNGCRPENWTELVERAISHQSNGSIKVVAIWTHLSGTSIESDREALKRFATAEAQAKALGFDGYRHAASSPAAYSFPDARFEMVRIGVSAFGTSPISGRSASDFKLDSPMALTAEVHSSGVITIGYLHGYFGSLSNKVHVVINNKKHKVLQVGPLASTIESGDYLPGDIVEVLGGHNPLVLTAEEVCNIADTVTDELFTGLKPNLTEYSA